MPFRKRRSRRMRKPSSAIKIAQSALSKVNSLSKKAEIKTIQSLTATTVVPGASSGLLSNVTAIATASGRDNRIGNKVEGLYGHIHGSVLFNSSSSTPDNQWVRLAIFADKNTIEGTPPTILAGVSATDLLEGSSFVSNFNTQTRNRYKLLKVINIQRDTQLNMGQEHYFKSSFKLPKRIEYNGGATTDGSKNAVWLAMWSNETLNAPTLFRTVRIWYTDA